MCSRPCGDIFFYLHVFVLDPGKFFSTAKLIVSELGFCFFGPVRLLRGPCLHRVGGNSIDSIVISAHIGLDVFWTLAPSILNPYTCFWTWRRVGGI